MDTDILVLAGLTKPQAKAYIALVENTDISAAALALEIKESRTNTYAILDKLLKYELATKVENTKYGAKYNACHPSALERLIENRRKSIIKKEETLKHALPELIEYYYDYDDRPGIMTYSGRGGIKKIHESIIEEKQDLDYLRSPSDSGYMSKDYILDYRTDRADSGITTRPIAPDSPKAPTTTITDKKYRIKDRAWLNPADYTANVEWNVYGDRVSIITYGAEAISLTIQSKSIAESVRQIFKIMRMGAKISFENWEKQRPKDYYKIK